MLKIPKSECPDIWTRVPGHEWPKSRSNIEDPVVPFERNLYRHPLARLLWERPIEEVLFGLVWDKVPDWECLFVHRQQGLFLSVYLDDIKIAGRKPNMAPMWKSLMKIVDPGEPTSFHDHENLECTQRECEPNVTIIDEYRKMFNSRISAGGCEKPHAKTAAWSHDMEGHAQKMS